MSKLLSGNRSFLLPTLIIALLGGAIRYANINFASLWADELYSMLSVHPGNSWYQILYMQRTYQPPLYFMVLWKWTKVFGYTDYAARLLSVVGGIAAIIISGYLGKTIKNNATGIIMAILVAFNPTQILYSLEARFYIFAYCFAVLSLMVYWNIITKKPLGYTTYFLKAIIDAALCYTHHFGIFFVFSMFLFDVLLYIGDKDKKMFWEKFTGYAIAAILYSPWFFWGLLKGMATTEFWLKEINIFYYFNFSLGLPFYINLIAVLIMAYFVYNAFTKREYRYLLLPFICFVVILLPLIYSMIRIPILVDRYSMVMAPAIYLMVSLGVYQLWKMIAHKKAVRGSAFLGICFIVFSFYGLYISFYNKEKLIKQPWREMAQWLQHQKDYNDVNIYSSGILLNNRFTIDFYLEPSKEAIHLNDIKIGNDKKMYLVECDGPWQVKDSVLSNIRQHYQIQKISFNEGKPTYGNIYVCTKK